MMNGLDSIPDDDDNEELQSMERGLDPEPSFRHSVGNEEPFNREFDRMSRLYFSNLHPNEGSTLYDEETSKQAKQNMEAEERYSNEFARISGLNFDSVHFEEHPDSALSQEEIDSFKRSFEAKQKRRKAYAFGVLVLLVMTIVLSVVASKHTNSSRSESIDNTVVIADSLSRSGNGNSDRDFELNMVASADSESVPEDLEPSSSSLSSDGEDDEYDYDYDDDDEDSFDYGDYEDEDDDDDDDDESFELLSSLSSNEEEDDAVSGDAADKVTSVTPYERNPESTESSQSSTSVGLGVSNGDCVPTLKNEESIFSDEVNGCDDCGPPQVTMDGQTSIITYGTKLYFYHHNEDNWRRFGELDVKNSKVNVMMSGDTAVVGSPTENDHAGAVHVVEKTVDKDNKPQYKVEMIVPQNLEGGDKFGESVGVRGDWMIAGAPGSTNPATSDDERAGMAYVYRRNKKSKDGDDSHESGWVLESIISPNGQYVSSFGMRVFMGNDLIAIAGFNANRETVLFLYELDPLSKKWEPLRGNEMGLTNNECKHDFGSHIAFTEDNGMIVGCTGKNSQPGEIFYYEFSEDQYVLKQKITSSDEEVDLWFAGSTDVAVDDDVMIVGSSEFHRSGRAYVFTKFGEYWIEASKVYVPEPGIFEFGTSVALSGNKMIVCSENEAHSFSLDGCRSPE